MTDPEEPGEPIEPDESDEPEDAKSPGPVPVASRAAQVGTVAVAVVVLLVLGVVWLVQRGDDDPNSKSKPSESAVTEVPSAPPSSFEPSRDGEDLPELPDVPKSLCPNLTLRTPISVLTFNIHSGQTGQSTRLERVASEIKAWKADVVLLQEVDDGRRGTGYRRQAEVLGGLTDMSWVYGGNQQRPDGGPIGNAILSKYPVVEWENIALPRAGGKQGRGLLHAVVDVEGTEISFYSTHFDHRSAGARAAQARATATVLAKDARPKVLGGDLNSGASSVPLGVLRGAGLGDVWAVGSGSGNTVPAANPRHRIDYLLHDGFFRPLQSVVLASAVSDHRAVWSRIEFREELECFKVGGD